MCKTNTLEPRLTNQFKLFHGEAEKAKLQFLKWSPPKLYKTHPTKSPHNYNLSALLKSNGQYYLDTPSISLLATPPP
jgi:hypothetical protein